MLNFIGVGSAFTPQLGNTSAYFMKNNDLYLIDCGELVFKELYHLIEFDKIDTIYIFITHTHSDHVGSLGTLISYLNIEYGLISNVYHGGVAIEKYLDLVGVSDTFYQASKVDQIKLDGVLFEFIETSHSDAIPSYGIVIETEETKLFYSGDASTLSPEILEAFLDGDIDYIYQDVSVDDTNTSHLSINILSDLIPQDLRERVIVMHLEEGAKEVISEFGFQIATPR